MSLIGRYRYPLALVLAVGCAIAAVFLTKHYFDARERQLREKIRMETQLTDVVVAKFDLAPGSRVNLDSMTIKSIPSEFVPDGAILPEHYPRVENKYLSAPISSGKPLTRFQVEGLSRINKFSDLLAFGQRALTLEVDGVSSIEHMIEAGDFIDIAVNGSKGKRFELLLENIRVLSTGNFSVADPKKPGLYKTAQYSTITVGVDGSYIQDIYEAQSSGDLVFLLRNEKDKNSAAYQDNKAGSSAVSILKASSEGGIEESVELVDANPYRLDEKKATRNSKGRAIKIARLSADKMTDSITTNLSQNSESKVIPNE